MDKQTTLFDSVQEDAPDELEGAFDVHGCCSRFRECSDAKKCLNPDSDIAKGCLYRENLEAGRIFYGKNRNFSNDAPVLEYIQRNSEKAWGKLSEKRRRMLLWARDVIREEEAKREVQFNVVRFSEEMNTQRNETVSGERYIRTLGNVRVQYLFDVIEFFFTQNRNQKTGALLDVEYVQIPVNYDIGKIQLPEKIKKETESREAGSWLQGKIKIQSEEELDLFKEMVRESFEKAYERYRAMNEDERKSMRPKLNGLCTFPE